MQAILNVDGRLELFARGDDKALIHIWQNSPAGPPWSEWESLLWPYPELRTGPLYLYGGLDSAPVVALNADGRLEVFAIGNRGNISDLVHIWQTAPGNGPWSSWASRGGNLKSEAPAVGRNEDGRLEVFACTRDNSMWHIWQTKASAGPWSEWLYFGGSFVGSPVVAENVDGRLEVFATGQNNAVWHNRQTSPNGSYSGWSQLGDQWMQGSPSVGMNADGRLEVFGCSTGLTGHIWQTAPSNGWSNWAYGLSAGPWFEAPSVASNADGRLEIFSVTEIEDASFNFIRNDIGHNWQIGPNSSNWNADSNFLGGSWTGGPVVVRNSDGRLEVFARGTDFRVYHIWQIEPNGGWSDWDQLGDWFVTDIGRTLIQT